MRPPLARSFASLALVRVDACPLEARPHPLDLDPLLPLTALCSRGLPSLNDYILVTAFVPDAAFDNLSEVHFFILGEAPADPARIVRHG